MTASAAISSMHMMMRRPMRVIREIRPYILISRKSNTIRSMWSDAAVRASRSYCLAGI
jgi:hypothetical protein